MTVYILPHKKSLKGTSYVKQVARRLYVVKGVTEFQMRGAIQGPGAEGFSSRVHGTDGRGCRGAMAWGAAPPAVAGREVCFPVRRQSSRPRVVTRRCPYQDVAK